MDSAIRSFVRQRAGNRCEYCLVHQAHYESTLHVDHIVAKQHGGSDDAINLALACNHCNLHKGPNLMGVDPDSGQIAPLFNPRTDSWPDHFEVQGARILGLTPTGRATVAVLAINASHLIDLRADLLALGEYP
jgi:HNH endonuclease